MEVFTKQAFDKGLISKLYIEFEILNTKKPRDNPVTKQDNETNIQLSKYEVEMSNKCAKKCQISVSISKMQIKTTLRILLTLVIKMISGY